MHPPPLAPLGSPLCQPTAREVRASPCTAVFFAMLYNSASDLLMLLKRKGSVGASIKCVNFISAGSIRMSKLVGGTESEWPLAALPPPPPPNPLKKLPAIIPVLQHMDALLCQNIHLSKLLSCQSVSTSPAAHAICHPLLSFTVTSPLKLSSCIICRRDS